MFFYIPNVVLLKKNIKKYDLFAAFGGSDSKNLLIKFFKEIINLSGKKVLLTNLET